MKILIHYSKTKREINGAFEILGTKEDLVLMAKQILHTADREDFCYGWITVRAEDPKFPGNVSPKGWDE